MRRLILGAVAVGALAMPSCNLLFAFAPDQVCETQIRATCHFAYACCDANERLAFGDVGVFRNEGECVQELLEEGGGNCANSFQVQEAVQQGRFEYDNVAAETCLKPTVDALNNCDAAFLFDQKAQADAAEENGCNDIDGFAFGKGKVKEGKACFNDFECEVAGSVCEPQEDDPDDDEVLVTRVGTCKSPGKEGDDCTADGTDGLCEPGTVCDGAECVAFDLLGNGEDCFDDAQCATGFCNNITPNVQPTCDDLLQEGDACFEDDDCEDLDCDDVEGVCNPPLKVVVEACNGLQGDDTQF